MKQTFKRPVVRRSQKNKNLNAIKEKTKLTNNLSSMQKAVDNLKEAKNIIVQNFPSPIKETHKLNVNILDMQKAVNNIKNANKNDNSNMIKEKQKLSNSILAMQKALVSLKGTERPVVKRTPTKTKKVNPRKERLLNKKLNSILKLTGHHNPSTKRLPHRMSNKH
jgi:hypothetical protein